MLVYRRMVILDSYQVFAVILFLHISKFMGSSLKMAFVRIVRDLSALFGISFSIIAVMRSYPSVLLFLISLIIVAISSFLTALWLIMLLSLLYGKVYGPFVNISCRCSTMVSAWSSTDFVQLPSYFCIGGTGMTGLFSLFVYFHSE